MKKTISNVLLIALILIGDIGESYERDTEIKDADAIAAFHKDDNSFYFLRPQVVQLYYSSLTFPATGGIIPSGIDGLRPNVVSFGSGNYMSVFLRYGNKFYHTKLNSSTSTTDVVVNYHMNNYQLVHIGEGYLLDTEINLTKPPYSIWMFLINEKGVKIKEFEIKTNFSSMHYVVKFREGGIVFFGYSSQLENYFFNNEMTFISNTIKSISSVINHIKVLELESNVFILCYISLQTLECLPGEYLHSPLTPSITWKSAFTVINPCDDVSFYQIAPIGDTGQAISICSEKENSGDFRIQKFNSRTKKGDHIQPNYYEIKRIYNIIQVSYDKFHILTYSFDEFFSILRMRLETYTFDSCTEYSIDVITNDKVSIKKSGIFTSDYVKVCITTYPKEGQIVGSGGMLISLDGINDVGSVYFQRGLSGTYYFRYEVTDAGSNRFTRPCKVTLNVKCHSACKSCSQMGTNTKNDCLSCSSGGLMLYNDLNPVGNCKSVCDDGYYVDNDLICRKCSNKCKTCQEFSIGDDDKCSSCPQGSVWVIKGNTYNCESVCPDSYYADSSSICVKCYNSCETCREGGSTSKHNCSKCLDGYLILALDYPATKYNCYLDECPDSYFVVNGKCTKCYDTCNACSVIGISTEHNCESCLENLFFLENAVNPSIGMCLEKCPDGTYAEEGKCLPCYDKCGTCDSLGNDIAHNCLSCPLNKKHLLTTLESEVGNCVSDCPSNSFPFPLNENKCIKCFPFCSICSAEGSYNKNNCLSCIEGFLKLPLLNGMNNCVYVCPDGYYTPDSISCYQCYSSCLLCSKGGRDSNHQCSKCKSGYIVHPLKPTNCVPDCRGQDLYWLFNTAGEYECTTKEECPTDNPMLEPKKGQCVNSCSAESNCLQCSKETLYQYKTQCVKECPEFYQSDASKICNRIPVSGLSPPTSTPSGDVSYESTNSKEDFINDLGNIIEKSLSDISNSKTNDSVIITKNENYEYIFYPSGADVKDKSNGATIDLGECGRRLKQANGIPENEELFIGQMIFPQNGKTDFMQYEVYDAKGTKLDMSICQDLTISIGQPLNIAPELLLEAKRLKDEYNLDAFDPDSDFYQDLCFNYTDVNNKDYTLETRREKFIEEKGFCTKDCVYAGIDFEANNVICNCHPVEQKIIPFIDESAFVNNLLSTFPLENLKMFVCFNLFLTPIILGNYGFITLLCILSLTIILFMVYFFYQMPLMYTKCPFIKINPPIKRKSQANVTNGDNGKSRNIKKNTLVIHHAKTNSDQGFDLKGKVTQVETPMSSTKQMPIYDLDKKTHANSELQELYNKNTVSIKTTQLEDIPFEMESNDELNEMEYKEAIVKDNRHFCKYYWSIIKEKEVLLSTFASDDPLNPVTQRIFVCFYILGAYLVISALFYTDAYVDCDNYFDIMFIVDNEFEKAIFSALIIKVLSKCIYVVLGLGKRIRKVFKEKESEKKYQSEIVGLIQSNKRNTIILFLLMIITELAMAYYITIFCRLYPHNQVMWFISTGFTIVFNLLLSAGLCLAMASTRYIAFCAKNECVYKVSGIISELM